MSDAHNGGHPELGPELRRLAQVILDRLDPAVRTAAARATESPAGPGGCQQVWCPVCALAALINGEQHPLLTVIAEHSVSLMTVVRAMVTDQTNGPEPPAPPNGAAAPTPAPTPPNRYEHIPIVVEQTSHSE